MKLNNLIIYTLALVVLISLFASVSSVSVSSRMRSRQATNSTNSTAAGVNSSDIYNGSNNNNTRYQHCPVATGSNININLALANFTAGLGNDITGSASGFNGDYAVGIANSVGSAGKAVENGAADVGAGIDNAADDVVNGAADAVKGVGNSIANAAYDVGNALSSDQTVTANQSSTADSTQDVNNNIETARANISDILDNQTSWTAADGNYNDLVVDLRVLLYLNQASIASSISIDNSSNKVNNQSQCTFIASGAYPSNTDACTNGFNVIQPYLVDFAEAAAINDTVAALYWILQVLPGMADLSNACLDAGFTFIEVKFDEDNCATYIQDLADLVSDLQNGDYFSKTTQQLNNRYIITRYIPRIVGYCLGTRN